MTQAFLVSVLGNALIEGLVVKPITYHDGVTGDCVFLKAHLVGSVHGPIEIPLLCPVCDRSSHLNPKQVKVLSKKLKGCVISEVSSIPMADIGSILELSEEYAFETNITAHFHVDSASVSAVFPLMFISIGDYGLNFDEIAKSASHAQLTLTTFTACETDNPVKEFKLFVSPSSLDLVDDSLSAVSSEEFALMSVGKAPLAESIIGIFGIELFTHGIPYFVIEDTLGGLHLWIQIGMSDSVLLSGYEKQPGRLSEVLDAIENGLNPTLLSPVPGTIKNNFLFFEEDPDVWDVIAYGYLDQSNRSVFVEDFGPAGKNEFLDLFSAQVIQRISDGDRENIEMLLDILCAAVEPLCKTPHLNDFYNWDNDAGLEYVPLAFLFESSLAIVRDMLPTIVPAEGGDDFDLELDDELFDEDDFFDESFDEYELENRVFSLKYWLECADIQGDDTLASLAKRWDETVEVSPDSKLMAIITTEPSKKGGIQKEKKVTLKASKIFTVIDQLGKNSKRKKVRWFVDVDGQWVEIDHRAGRQPISFAALILPGGDDYLFRSVRFERETRDPL